MKQQLTFFLCIAICTTLFGQIATTKIAPVKEKVSSSQYDSTLNFLGNNPINYIGQDFYLKGLQKKLRNYGYFDFLLDYNESVLNKENIYKGYGEFTSKYSDLAEKYFQVVEVIKDPMAAPGMAIDTTLYVNSWYIKLKEKTSGDIVYYKYNGKNEFKFPFIVVGFFEKQKKRIIGTEILIRDDFIATSSDIMTGNIITTRTGQKWKCIDLTIDEEYYNLSLILQNSLGEKIDVSYDMIFGFYRRDGRFYTIVESEYYRKLFGSLAFELILQGKINIGFTKEMCRFSWGEPKEIIITTENDKNSERWKYGKGYLEFVNNLVSAIH